MDSHGPVAQATSRTVKCISLPTCSMMMMSPRERVKKSFILTSRLEEKEKQVSRESEFRERMSEREKSQ